ncbi:MAG: tetratricopeptide repeat protein, partial [Pseudomonadota bacterium]|nr:tetratricopeptide repeat protein [Pseudomonadota bacterium]
PPMVAAQITSAQSTPVQSTPAQTPPAAAPTTTGDRNAAVRISRELSFEDRDRNNSQSALMLVQGGRMAEALQQLLTFLEENRAAHQSRETLAKLLLAQQAFAQADTVIDQGLEQVPNYAPFKKIKARLLMQNGDGPQALALLRNVPPSVAADPEYHELLATLYQQGNYHVQAIASYQDLLRTDRNQGRWWTGLGISLEAQNQLADARASYQQALQSPNLDANLRRFVQNRIANPGSPQ